MTVAVNPDVSTQGEAPTWAWPLYAFVAWLAGILGYIARFKRARRFRQDWRDSWEGLRQSEWLRDQLIARGVAQLLSGHPLQLDDTKISLTPPATHGGPCPRTPFEMNRRFLALARWAADPEAIIRARFRRVARDALVAHGSTGALRAAHHEAEFVSAISNGRVALILSSDRRERPSKDEGVLTKARGPPELSTHALPTAHNPRAPRATGIAPLRLEHPAPRRTSGGPMSHRSAASWRTRPAAGGVPFPDSSTDLQGSAFGELIHNELQDRPRRKPVLFFFIFSFVLVWWSWLLMRINAPARQLERQITPS